MSAARVVNPFSLNEMRRLRDAVKRPASALVPDPEARARVCRNLYGRSSPEDTRAFVNRELAAQRERASERWGFDFLREVPRTSDRFVWCKVKPGGVPAAYALRRMACLGGTLTVKVCTPAPAPQPSPSAAALQTASTTVATAAGRREATVPEAAIPWEETAAVSKPVVDRTPSPIAVTALSSKRQAHITEYMKCRKRPSSTSKDSHPTKRPRNESCI